MVMELKTITVDDIRTRINQLTSLINTLNNELGSLPPNFVRMSYVRVEAAFKSIKDTIYLINDRCDAPGNSEGTPPDNIGSGGVISPADYAELLAKIQTNQEAILQLKGKVDNIEAGSTEGIQEQIDELNDKIDAIEVPDLSEINIKIDANNSSIASILQTLESLEIPDISELEERVSTNEDNISNMQSEIADTKDIAQDAKTASEQAATSAATSLQNATTAQQAANQSLANSQAAQSAAELSASNSQAAQNAAEETLASVQNVAEVAENAQTTANTAKTTADAAKTAADGAKTAADAVQAAVENETTGLAATKAIADSAKTTAEAALPRAGGEMSGNLFIYCGKAVDGGNGERASLSLGGSDKKKITHLISFYNKSTNSDIGAASTLLRVFNHNIETQPNYTDLTINLDDDGRAYGLSPQPRDSYGNDIVTTKYAKDKFLQKLSSQLILYVGGAGASDTADLFAGRGMTADKPFATLDAAWKYGVNNFCGGAQNLHLVVQADLACGIVFINSVNINAIVIKSDSVKRNITLTRLEVGAGAVQLENIKLTAGTGSPYILAARSAGTMLTLDAGVELYGAPGECAVKAKWGGMVLVNGDIGGSVTGKRYICEGCGRIVTNGRGATAIPGTEAGTCDASSVYI